MSQPSEGGPRGASARRVSHQHAVTLEGAHDYARLPREAQGIHALPEPQPFAPWRGAGDRGCWRRHAALGGAMRAACAARRSSVRAGSHPCAPRRSARDPGRWGGRPRPRGSSRGSESRATGMRSTGLVQGFASGNTGSPRPTAGPCGRVPAPAPAGTSSRRANREGAGGGRRPSLMDSSRFAKPEPATPAWAA
jgi:hypothetical protein